MTVTHVPTLEHAIHVTNEWLRDVASVLQTDDRHEAYRALRSTMHVLRDRLPVDENAKLAAQLPDVLRGVYYEGWHPSRTPARFRTYDELLERVAREGAYHGHTEASYALTAALAIMRRRISAGEMAGVAAALPAEIADVVSG